MSPAVPFLAAFALVVSAWVPADALPPERFPLDPVHLLRGEQVAGRDEYSVVRGSYRYVFADEASFRTFLADPDACSIRQGGACARMGPLSGRGSVEIFAVHEGALYLFASEACRTTFLKAPEARLEHDDAQVVADDSARARGEALLARVVDALGGAEALDAATSLVLEDVHDQEHSGKSYEVGRAWRVRLPAASGVRTESWWQPGYRRADVFARTAFTASDEGTRPLDAEQRRALERRAYRLPLVLLSERARADFVAAHDGTDTLDGTPVERLKIALSGITTTLLVDGAGGELLGEEYTGRGPDATLGTVRLRFTRFVAAGGVRVPAAWTAEFDSEPAAELARDFTHVEVGAVLDDALFVP